jgi:hypothetical protein
MKDTQDIFDIINLEYFISRDNNADSDTIHRRDRQLCLEMFDPADLPDRKALIFSWLQKRCLQEKTASDSFLPGILFREIYRTVSIVVAAAGFITGLGAAAGVLHYTGERPVNVFVYLFVFVILQFFLSLVSFGLIIRRKKLTDRSFSIFHTVLAGVVSKLFQRAEKQVSNMLDAEKRIGLQAVLGHVKGLNQIYGTLFYWPIFLMAQLAAVSFQCGVLLSTISLVLVRDIAFGWQSTVQVSSSTVFAIIQTMAVPWRFLLGEGLGYPGFSEITGSHIVLKDGIYHLVSSDLSSWWPFLCLSVFFYGLLPRFFLLLGGLFKQKRALEIISFKHSSVEALLYRMRTPVVTTTSEVSSSEVNSVKNIEKNEQKTNNKQEELSLQENGLIVLVADELLDLYDQQGFKNLLTKQFGYEIIGKFVIGRDYEEDLNLIKMLSLKDWQEHPGILFLAEGWMAPINDTLDILKGVRESIGKEVPLRVGLLGKVRNEVIPLPSAVERKVWQDRLNSLGDPWLQLEIIRQ